MENNSGISSDSLVIIKAIDVRTQEHSVILKSIAAEQIAHNSHLRGIATNTADMASTLKQMHEDNRSVIGYMAGKKQVPLSIFLAVVGLLVVLHLIDVVQQSYNTVKISPNGIEIIPPLVQDNSKKN